MKRIVSARLFSHLSHLLVATGVAALALTGCGKKGDDSSKGGGSGSGSKSGPETVTLKKVDGIKATLPAGANIRDGIGGKGVMIQAPGLVVSIISAGANDPKTAAEAKKGASMYSPKKMRTEKLSDGWAMTFENKGGMGTNYFVKVRRELGGKAYMCTTTASKPAQQKNALKVCKGLKK